MKLPQELDFLKSLDKYKSDDVLDIDLGNGDIFSFKLLTTDEQIRATEITSQEASVTNQLHYVLSFRKNVMALSLVKINDHVCPKPDTVIYDENDNPVSSFLDVIKSKLGEMEESFFNTVAQRVESFQGKMVQDSLKRLGVRLEDVAVPSVADYEKEIETMTEEDDQILNADQQGSLESQVMDMADRAFGEDSQQQEDLRRKEQELAKDLEESQRLKAMQYQAQVEAQRKAEQQQQDSKVVSQEEYFQNQYSKGIGSVSKSAESVDKTAPLYNFNHTPKPSYPKAVRKG